jgi:hypothetical protein
MRRRLLSFISFLVFLVAVAIITQVTLTPVPAQMAEPKMTGKIQDKVIKSFDSLGLPGIHSIQYRRFTMSPGAKIEGTVVFDDHAELCEPKKGVLTATLDNGSKVVFRAGAILNVPLNTKTKLIVADLKAGFEELYWSINVKERK